MTAWSQATDLSRDGRMTIRKVTSPEAADDGAVKITLFRAANDGTCGWYIGPLSVEGGKVTIPYLPKSAETIASVAVVRAVRAAERLGKPVYLIDPDNLWTHAWRS